MRSWLLASSLASVHGFRSSVELTAQREFGRSAGRLAAVGQTCHGGGWLFSDGCSNERVTDLEGKPAEVALSCFRRGGRKPDEVVGWNEEGECFIPKDRPCDEDDQCRNGTSCRLDKGGDAYTCQEVAADHTFDEASAAEVAAHVATTILSMAESLYNSELLSGVRAPVGFMDERSGAMSPYVVNPALAKYVLAEVVRSFASATVKGEDAASRSGSLFLISGDGRFLAKSVREAEYEEFAGHLIGPLARHADLAMVNCSGWPSDACWAHTALRRTSLNIPVLAFVHDDRYWVIMPASDRLRGLSISRSVSDLQPLGAAEYYDVKPVWAKSRARRGFVQKLVELGMNLGAPVANISASLEMQGQWAALKGTVEGDIDFLSRESSDDAPLIDYSILFELYAPGRRTKVWGNHCLEAPSCFEEDPAACHVLCVSIIDFFTKFTFDRWLESWWKKFKFHDYAQKTKDLLECPLNQSFPSADDSDFIESISARPLDGRSAATRRPVDGMSGPVQVDVHVKWTGIYKESACKPYLDMTCDAVVINTISKTDDCAPWFAKPRYCFKASCTFQVEARYAGRCGSWMQEWCQEYIAVHNTMQMHGNGMLYPGPM